MPVAMWRNEQKPNRCCLHEAYIRAEKTIISQINVPTKVTSIKKKMTMVSRESVLGWIDLTKEVMEVILGVNQEYKVAFTEQEGAGKTLQEGRRAWAKVLWPVQAWWIWETEVRPVGCRLERNRSLGTHMRLMSSARTRLWQARQIQC